MRKLAEGARKIPFQLGSGSGIPTGNSFLYLSAMLQEILEYASN